MMDKFSEREKAYENKFVHDSELEFKITALTNKNLGLWAAEKMNMSNDVRKNYAKDLMNYMIDHDHDLNKLIAKISDDFYRRNIDISDKDINIEYNKLKESSARSVMEK